jgi:maltoporin
MNILIFAFLMQGLLTGQVSEKSDGTTPEIETGKTNDATDNKEVIPNKTPPKKTETEIVKPVSKKVVVPTSTNIKPEHSLPTPLKKSKKESGKFGFGSYGRVNFGTNMDGEPIYPINITSHGPRLEEATYVELDFYYIMRLGSGVKTKTVSTLALNDSLFHYTGDWSTNMAIRNLYLEVSKDSLPSLSLWVGSRMYRGDDIYLLDYWPLDNLNTLGAGVWYDSKPIRAGFHVGTNRVFGPYQFQEEAVSTPFVGTENIPTLNRQRTIASFKFTWWKKFQKSVGIKFKGYSELHFLPSGTYNALGEPEERIDLPKENGYVVGGQIGVWNFAPHSFANIFAKYRKGLGAYGEFSQPLGNGFFQDVDNNYSASGAEDFVLAFSANYVIPKRFGLMAGGYFRSFKDADSLEYDWDDGYEYVLSLRPHLWIPELLGDNIVLAGEASYQVTERSGLHPDTNSAVHPKVMKLSFLPTWISGTNTYSRPAIRFVYTFIKSNSDARLWYHEQDYRRSRSVEHFFGIQAEWWFNSSTYK